MKRRVWFGQTITGILGREVNLSSVTWCVVITIVCRLVFASTQIVFVCSCIVPDPPSCWVSHLRYKSRGNFNPPPPSRYQMPLPRLIWCFHHSRVEGGSIFSVWFDETHTWWVVTHLKQAIKGQLPNTLATVAADALTLYRVAINESSDPSTRTNELGRLIQNLNECTELDEKQQLSAIFDESPPPGMWYIILVTHSKVVGSIYLCIYSMYAHVVVSLNTWPQNLQSLIPPPSD